MYEIKHKNNYTIIKMDIEKFLLRIIAIFPKLMKLRLIFKIFSLINQLNH